MDTSLFSTQHVQNTTGPNANERKDGKKAKEEITKTVIEQNKSVTG